MLADIHQFPILILQSLTPLPRSFHFPNPTFRIP